MPDTRLTDLEAAALDDADQQRARADAAEADLQAVADNNDHLRARVAQLADKLHKAQQEIASLTKAGTAWANENERLREQLASFEALLNQAHDRLDDRAAENQQLREQLFAQTPVIEAAQAWAELHFETDDVTPSEARKVGGALYNAIEQHRLMDLALTTAREEAEATR